jgi:hypothetical protein
VCPDGQDPVPRSGRPAVYTKEFRGRVCRARDRPAAPPTDRKVYRGTLRGGLRLAADSRERGEPVVGRVDDLAHSDAVNVEKMVGEHFKEPEHFGIHVSHLDALKPSGVREDRPQDMSIIAGMFD